MDRLWVPERGKPGEARGRKHRPRAGQPGSELTSACDDLVTWLPWPGSPRTAGRTSPPLGCRSPAASAAASGGALPTTALPRVPSILFALPFSPKTYYMPAGPRDT